MSKPKKPKPFRIFRVGTHVDSAGHETTFTREQLEATVKAYNEGEWRAPMVVGHPKGTAPAYGWVGKMRIDDNGEVYVDDVEKLNQDFAELMDSGAYRNRSASWYAPDHPSNPTPGVWQLRHLGMLGAQPPALKGLGDVEFHDQDGITVEFADYTMSTVAYLFRSLRELIIAKWGTEDADKAIPSYHVSDLEMAGHDRVTETTPNFSDTKDSTMTPEEIAALKARAEKAEADAATAQAAATAAQAQVAQFSEAQKTAARAAALVEARGVLQPLVTSGRLLPAQLNQVAEFVAGLDDQTKTYEFGEHTGDNKLTARALFVELLGSAGKQVDYSEHTAAASLPQNLTPEQLADKAREYQEAKAAKGVTVTSTEAVNAVLAGRAA